MKSTIRRVDLKEATNEELLNFSADAGVEGVKPRMKRDQVIDLLTVAGYGAGIFVGAAPAQLAPHPPHLADTDEFDPENERWARVKFQLSDGSNSETPIFVSINQDFAHLPRGVDLVIRERFYHHIRICKEIRREQRLDHKGPLSSYRDHEVKEVERYPLTFSGFCGYVKDGPPDVGSDVQVIGPSGPTEAQAAARTQRVVRERAAA